MPRRGSALGLCVFFSGVLATELFLLACGGDLLVVRDTRFGLVDVPSHALDVAALHRPVRQRRRGSLLVVGHRALSFDRGGSTLVSPFAAYRSPASPGGSGGRDGDPTLVLLPRGSSATALVPGARRASSLAATRESSYALRAGFRLQAGGSRRIASRPHLLLPALGALRS